MQRPAPFFVFLQKRPDCLQNKKGFLRMFMLKDYKISAFVSFVKNDEGVISCYNWKNGESVDFFEKCHPAYKLFNQEPISDFVEKQEWIDDLTWLTETGFITPIRNEKETIVLAEQPEILHLIILPAGEACNLRCVYCYEAHEDVQRMNVDHIERIVKLCEQYKDKFVRIEYFGGEPLLNKNFISKLASELNLRKIPFTASITTNATLINENILTLLYQSNVKVFQITIDGVEETHNTLRPAFNHQENSFQAVCNALRVIQKSSYKDLKIFVRSNVNEKSISSQKLEAFFNTIKSIIPVNDKRFSFLFRPIGDYAAANERKAINQESICNHANSNEVTTTIENFFESAGYLLADTQMMISDGGYSCYANEKNSFVISPDFSIKKCTVALNDPLNNVGTLKENGKIAFNDNYSLWLKKYSDEECYSCYMFRSCRGNGCTLANIKNNQKNCPPNKKQKDKYVPRILKFIEKMEA